MSVARVNKIETLDGKGEGLISYPYEDNLVIDSHNTVLREGDQEYKLSESVTLPYTTTGAGLPEGGAFVTVGDAALRQELAADGSEMVTVSTATGVQSVAGALDSRVVYVGSVAELRSSDFSCDSILLQGFYGKETPGGGPMYADREDSVTPDNGSTVVIDSTGLRWKAGPGFVFAESFTVPVSGSLLDAINDLSSIRPAAMSPTPVATLELQAGYSLQEQVTIKKSDLGWVEITSVDATVPVLRSEINQPIPADSNRFPVFFFGDGCRAPTINCLFSMDESGVADDRIYGFRYWSSFGIISTDAGIKNVPGRGMEVAIGAQVVARRAVIKNCGLVNVRVSNNGKCELREADITGSALVNIAIGDDSIVHLQSASVGGAGTVGMAAAGSGAVIYAGDANFDNCVEGAARVSPGACLLHLRGSSMLNCGFAIVADGGIVHAPEIIATGCTESAITAKYGAIIDVSDSDISNCEKITLNAQSGSHIIAERANISGAQLNSIRVDCAKVSGSNINSENCAAGAGQIARVTNGGELLAPGANMRGRTDGNGVSVSSGSRATLTAADFSGTTVGARDISLLRGSIVSANEAIEGSSLYPSGINLLTENGIVFATEP